MEENLLEVTPDFKLYKDRAIYVGTLFGGPLVGGYLAAENYRQLGQQDKVKITWTIAIVATIVVFGAAFWVPDIEKLPRYILPLIYSAITQMLIQKYQGSLIKAHIENGGQTYSVWRAVWIGLVGLVALMAIIFAILLFANRDVL